MEEISSVSSELSVMTQPTEVEGGDIYVGLIYHTPLGYSCMHNCYDVSHLHNLFVDVLELAKDSEVDKYYLVRWEGDPTRVRAVEGDLKYVRSFLDSIGSQLHLS